MKGSMIMPSTRKLFSLFAALCLVLSLAVPGFAQEVGTAAENTGTITVTNAAKGETYTIYQLFDATVTGSENGSIAYTGTIPAELAPFFSQDSAGNISATDAAKNGENMSDALKEALTAWAKTAQSAATAVSDGSILRFRGLPYGYYVVTTTQGQQAITVDSTNPNVTIVDKNSTTPNSIKKTVDDDDVSIGDTVTYTVSFQTANFDGAGTQAKQITAYTIHDTLPAFLADVEVIRMVVDNDGSSVTADDCTELSLQQFADKKITIPWVDGEGNSLYKNGTYLLITYTARVTEDAAIAGQGNKNEVTATWDTTDGPGEDKLTTEEVISTYAIALKKVNEKGEPLSGAVFQLPFYVQSTPDTDGAYLYAGTDAGEGLTDTITTPDNGELLVKGVQSGTYSITEIQAPQGYNKLTEPISVTAVKTSETTTSKTFYIDENGQITDEETTVSVTYENTDLAATVVLVVNRTGSKLPSTGGVGTTWFYIIGTTLTLGALALLAGKKRAENAR